MARKSRKKMTAAQRRAYNAYMRKYMAERYWRLKRDGSTLLRMYGSDKPRDRGRRRRWSPAEEIQLRAQYPHMATKVIAIMLDRHIKIVWRRARLLGLSKSDEYMASDAAARIKRGVAPNFRRHQFPKGHVPANKGLRRPGYAPGRTAETQFKKGQQNHNFMPIGATRLSQGYIYIKIAAVRYVPYTVNWVPLHVLEWERANGRPVPKGHSIAFINGDRSDIRLDNLECISRAALMKRNTVHNLPKPLAQVVQLRGALIRQIKRRERNGTSDRGSAGSPVRDAGSAAGSGEADGHRAREGSRGGREGDRRLGEG